MRRSRSWGSTLALYDCRLQGGEGIDVHPDYDGFYASDGGDGCRARGSFLFASNTLFRGGNGGAPEYCEDNWASFGYPGDGGDGLEFPAGSHPCSAKLLDVDLVGGEPGLLGDDCWYVLPGSDGEDLRNDSSSSVEFLDGVHRRMTIEPWGLDGATVQATFEGVWGDKVFLPRKKRTGFAYDDLLKGVWVLETPVMDLGQPVGVIPGFGPLSVQIELPGLTVESALALFQQAYFVDWTGQPILGTPASTLVLRD